MRRSLFALALLFATACDAPSTAPSVSSQRQALPVRDDDPDPIGPRPIIVRPRPRRLAPQPVQVSRTSLRARPPTFVDDEVVGMVPGNQACPPDNAQWDGGDLFGDVFVRSREGQRFCHYSWRGEGRPTLSSLPAYCPDGTACQACPAGWTCDAPARGDVWLEPNHKALYKAGLPAEVTSVVAAAVKAQHLAAIGAPARMPSGAHASEWFRFLPALTRVVVLDDDDVHGDTVERWIRQTACPAGGCGVYVERRNVFNGGDVTSSLHLAQQIVEAVRSGGVRTVLNLSAGFYWEHAWLGRPNSNDDVAGADLRIVHKALQAALNYASCQGAITVAAAGNRDGGAAAEAQGPRYYGGSTAYPAAFSSNGGQGWTCNTNSPAASGRVIIHPVSSIRPSGAIASSTRQHGQACMVAPGLALTPDDGPIEGTSFATAALTGAVAATWSYMPLEDPNSVMAAVRSGMPELAGSPLSNACSFSSDNRIKRLHLCAAVDEALERTCAMSQLRVCSAGETPGPSRCLPSNDAHRQYGFACGLAAQVSCSPIPALHDRLEIAPSDGDTLLAAASDPERLLEREFAAGSVSALPAANQCGLCVVHSDPDDRNAYTCPFGSFDNGQREPSRLSRSPEVPGCRSCSLVLGTDRSLWLIGSQLDSQLSSPAVRLSFANRPLQGLSSFFLPVDEVYELGESLLASSEDFSIKLSDPLPDTVTVRTAELSFMLSDQNQAAFSRTLPVLDATGD
jgi:hypothetical protein